MTNQVDQYTRSLWASVWQFKFLFSEYDLHYFVWSWNKLWRWKTGK